MTTLRSFSASSESARRGNSGGQCPVLAQLPDISDQLASSAPRTNRAAAAGFVSYRFDPPEKVDRQAQGVRRDAGPVGSAVQPHMVRRSASGMRRESTILPNSNPFEIPSASMEDALAPIARFLFLFALFTAIGTSILTISRRPEGVDDLAEPAAASAHQSLEPQRLTPSTDTIEPPAALPTATGPLGTEAPRTGLRIKEGKHAESQNPQSSAISEPALPGIAESREQTVPHARTSDDPVAVDAHRLPEAPAIARLSGTILSTPTQQAHHDNNQSSLY